jgi:hypothetical protein
MPALNVLHRCDTPACVNPAHLFLGTRAQNTADMMSKGRNKFVTHFGSDCGASKLLEGDVIVIRKAVEEGATQRKLAADYGVTPQCINLIVKRRNWRHLQSP